MQKTLEVKSRVQGCLEFQGSEYNKSVSVVLEFIRAFARPLWLLLPSRRIRLSIGVHQKLRSLRGEKGKWREGESDGEWRNRRVDNGEGKGVHTVGYGLGLKV